MQDFQVENGKPIYNLQQFLRIIAQANGRELTLIPDGIYGAQTQAAVIEFQRDNGLSPTGEVDNDTWDKIIEEYSRVVVYILPPPCTSLFPSAGHVIRIGDRANFHYPIQAVILAIAKKLDNIDEFEISDTHTGDVVETTRQLQRLLESDCDGEIDVNCWRELSRLYENLVSKDTFRLDSENKENQRNVQPPFSVNAVDADEIRRDIIDMYPNSLPKQESGFAPRLDPYNIRAESANETTLPTTMQPQMQMQNPMRPIMPGQMQNIPQIPTVEEQDIRRSESDRMNNATDMENNVVPNKVNTEQNNAQMQTQRTNTQNNNTKKPPLRWNFR
ncbi:MAG: peptidoglycan-binding protein [Ruminococcaceae bacterium]|nr:peptidoglycan-binding protein [Oscillospiraceae bacterium]